MICGMTTTQIEMTLRSLSDSPLTFFLTGSRFFGFSNENSDYDFFVQDSEEVNGILRAWGFVEVPRQGTISYHDMQTIKVFRKIVKEQNGTTIQIDIQVVRDYGLKIMAQNILQSVCPELVSGNKNNVVRKRLWAYAYSMASVILAHSGK